jgi:hypothetical protein
MLTSIELKWIEDNKSLIEQRDLPGLLNALESTRVVALSNNSKMKFKILLPLTFWGEEGLRLTVQDRGESRSERRKERGDRIFRFSVQAKTSDLENSPWFEIVNFRGTFRPDLGDSLVIKALVDWMLKVTGNPRRDLIKKIWENRVEI